MNKCIKQKTAWSLIIFFVMAGFLGGYILNFDQICHQIVEKMNSEAFPGAGDFWVTRPYY